MHGSSPPRGHGRRPHDSDARLPIWLGASVRRGALLAVVLLLAAGAYGLLTERSDTHATPTASKPSTGSHGLAAVRTATRAPHAPSPPPLVVTAPTHPTGIWTVVARVHGQPAAWLAQRSGVTLMRFDQGLMHLTLHAGSSDGGVSGWTYGDHITPREIHLLIAAVNGGFKLTYSDVGFVSGGHVAVPLKAGLASIVTYTDGTTNVGAWREGLPSASKRVFSVLQNQQLLVDRGAAAASVSNCVLACWGATIGDQTVVARSGLGITANGQLVWGAGEQLLPADLAAGLIGAGAVRAIELDINPDWVAGYLYVHHPGGPSPAPVVSGQLGIAGKLLEPYSRDFLAFVAN
jgi:hypothetical protein